jgi:hypothetical protein
MNPTLEFSNIDFFLKRFHEASRSFFQEYGILDLTKISTSERKDIFRNAGYYRNAFAEIVFEILSDNFYKGRSNLDFLETFLKYFKKVNLITEEDFENIISNLKSNLIPQILMYLKFYEKMDQNMKMFLNELLNIDLKSGEEPVLLAKLVKRKIADLLVDSIVEEIPF